MVSSQITGWFGIGLGVLNTIDQEVLVNKLSAITSHLGELKVPLSSPILNLAETQSLATELLTLVANHTTEDLLNLAEYTGDANREIALAIQCTQTQ